MRLLDCLEPTAIVPPKTTAADPRLGQLFGTQPETVQIIGFPSDEGVRRNGGRPGAALAPEAIRVQLYKMTPDPRRPEMAELARTVHDLGNIRMSGDLEADQECLGRIVAGALEAGRKVIVLGGGHETAYGHFLGYAKDGYPVSIVNFDAHADVRELKEGLGHSGSPFRQAMDHPSGTCRSYDVAGLLPWSVSKAHLEYVLSKGGKAIFRDELDLAAVCHLLHGRSERILATFDIDAVEQADSPGVSAPGAGGMPIELWLAAAAEAGRAPSVHSIDIVETNPNFDPDHRTERLAALTVWHFLRGLTERKR